MIALLLGLFLVIIVMIFLAGAILYVAVVAIMTIVWAIREEHRKRERERQVREIDRRARLRKEQLARERILAAAPVWTEPPPPRHRKEKHPHRKIRLW